MGLAREGKEGSRVVGRCGCYDIICYTIEFVTLSKGGEQISELFKPVLRSLHVRAGILHESSLTAWELQDGP